MTALQRLFRSPIALPLVVAAAFASLWIIIQPDPLVKDAGEYHGIAEEIVQHGRFWLNGAPTMLREPLYPLFRAGLYALHIPPTAVPWVQIGLLLGIIYFVTRAIAVLDPRAVRFTAWACALFPGLTVIASRQYADILAVFFVALAGYMLMRVRDAENDAWRFSAWVGMAAGAAALTRGAYQFFGIACAIAVWFLLRKQPLRKRILCVFLTALVSVAVLVPWMTRNAVQFGHAALTLRAGTVLFTRAEKAAQPWERLAASAGSVLIGQAAMSVLTPQHLPIITDAWRTTWATYAARQEAGLSVDQIDAALLSEATARIKGDAATFFRYVLWTPVDVWRLLALPSPRTPVFSIEGMFISEAQAGRLTLAHVVILLGVHALEWVWVFGTLIGLWIGIRRWGAQCVPVWVIGYTMLIHAPLDNIVRYGAPLIPWRLALLCVVALWLWDRMRLARAQRPTRILLLATSDQRDNGWGVEALAIQQVYRDLGHDVELFATQARFVASCAAFLKWKRGRRFDMVHVCSEWVGYLALLTGRPSVVTVNGSFVIPRAHGSWIRALLFWVILFRARRIMSISHFTKQYVPARFHKKTRVIPLGVDPEMAQEPWDKVEWSGSPRILSVGVVKPRKGFLSLIEGFARLQARIPNAHLWIAGDLEQDPAYVTLLRQRIQELGLASHVRLMGHVARRTLLGLFRACDVFALTFTPSNSVGAFDGFGLVYLEANVFGKPTVGSRGSAAEDAICDGVSGVLCDAQQPDAVAASIERALTLRADDIRAWVNRQRWDDRAPAFAAVLSECLRQRQSSSASVTSSQGLNTPRV